MWVLGSGLGYCLLAVGIAAIAYKGAMESNLKRLERSVAVRAVVVVVVVVVVVLMVVVVVVIIVKVGDVIVAVAAVIVGVVIIIAVAVVAAVLLSLSINQGTSAAFNTSS